VQGEDPSVVQASGEMPAQQSTPLKNKQQKQGQDSSQTTGQCQDEVALLKLAAQGLVDDHTSAASPRKAGPSDRGTPPASPSKQSLAERAVLESGALRDPNSEPFDMPSPLRLFLDLPGSL